MVPRRDHSARVAALAAVASLAACTPKPAHTIPVALLVDGDAGAIAGVAGLDLRRVALPEPSAPAPLGGGEAITRARAAYKQGNFDACRTELGKLDVTTALAAHERGLAARLLLIAAACEWGDANRAQAQSIAARFASFGLDLPEQLMVSPEVEAAFGDAVVAAGKSARTPLAITGEAGGRVSLDGRDATCTLPCTIDVAAGEHVLAVDTDGFRSATRVVRAPAQAPIALVQEPADAELAARQWRARLGRGLPPADMIGARLLAQLSNASRVAYVHGDTRLAGALVVDGKLVANGTSDRGDELVRELAYDGGLLQRPALWQRPWFWIAIGGAAIVIGGTIAAVTYQRPVHTDVGF